jgi:NRPS condensation-like uncharacterized protein
VIPDRFPATTVDLFAHLMRMRTDNGVGGCVVTLDGHIDEARLRRTIRLALDAEPIVGCRLVDSWYRPYWQRRADLDQLDLCPVAAGDARSPAFLKFLTDSIDPLREPLMQVRIFRSADDTICFKGAHAVADGPSAARFFHYLMTLYRRLKNEPDYVPPTNVGGLRDYKADVFKGKFGLRQIPRLLKELKREGAVPAATWLFPEYTDSRPVHGYTLLKLPPSRVRAMSRYGFERQSTMTSVVLAGIYLAALKVFRLASEDCATFTATADMRRFLAVRRQEYAVSNMSAPGRFTMDPRRDRSFEVALLSVRDQLKKILKDPTSVPPAAALIMCLASLPFAVLRRVADRRIRQASESPERRWGLANPGEVDLALLHSDDVPVRDAFLFGPLVIGPGVAMISSIFRGSLTLTLGQSGRTIEAKVIRQLLEQVDRELPFYEQGAGTISTLSAEAPPETAGAVSARSGRAT